MYVNKLIDKCHCDDDEKYCFISDIRQYKEEVLKNIISKSEYGKIDVKKAIEIINEKFGDL